MQYTKNQIERLIDKYDKMLELVDYYLIDKYPKERRGETRIKYGRIEEYVNFSCHCHPEYDWSDRGSVEDFIEWISTKDGYKTKYYTVN